MDILKNTIKNWLGIDTTNKTISVSEWRELISSTYGGDSNILANPVLNRAINLIANNIAKLPITYWRGDTEVDEPPFNFDYPNPYQTRNDFITQCVINYVIDNEVIIQIIDKPVVGKYMLIIPRAEATVATYSNGFPLSWKINGSIVPAENIIYITNSLYKATTISIPSRPLKLIDIVLQNYLIDINSDKYLADFFANYCAISGIFSSNNGSIIPQDVMDKIITAWNSRHQGVGKSHKVAGIGGDVKFTPIASQSVKDMEMNITKDGIRDTFLLTLGVPKSIVGVTDAVDRAVADTHMRSFWQLTLIPILSAFEDKFNKYFSTQFRKYGVTMEFDLSEVDTLKKDKQQQVTLLQSLMSAGYTQTEAAEYVGLEIEANTDIGDIRFIPSNLIQFTDNSIMDDVLPPENSAGDTQEDEDTTNSGIDNTNKSINKSYKIDKSIQVNLFNKYQQKHEKIIKGKVKHYFMDQRIDILKLVNSKDYTNRSKYELLHDIKNYLAGEKQIGDRLTSVMEDTYRSGSDLAYDMLGKEKKGLTTINDNVIQSRKNYLRGVNEETYNILRSKIVVDIQNGETIDTISKTIKSVFNMSNYRANVISRTESAALLNLAANDRYGEIGIEYKSWSSPKSREAHFANHSQGKIPFDQAFSSGEMFPHSSSDPSLTINCTCCLIPEGVGE